MVMGRQLMSALAALNVDELRLFTIRLKKYQLPNGMPESVTGGHASLGWYGCPLALMAVVPANMRCASVGVGKAEYQTSAYCVMPEVLVVTLTSKLGMAALGCALEITGAGTKPKVVGEPMPVLGAGVNCVIATSS